MYRWKLFGLLILIIILTIIPLVVHSPYHIHLLIMVGINAILAMTFIMMLRAGLISLAIAAFWGIGAYASALLSMKLNLSFWLALPASTLITGIVAVILGLLLARFSGYGFLILTVVLGMVVRLAFGTFGVFGGYVGINNILKPEPIIIPFLAPIEFISKAPYYYLMLSLILLVIAVFSAFYSAWTGRAWRAIELSPHLAESLGINPFKYRLLAFVVASTTAGLVGSFYAHYYGAIIPSTFDIFKTIYVHVYAVLGGINFAIFGPVIGSIVMTIIPELLRLASEIEPIITGLLLILLMLFLPSGLLGLGQWSLRSAKRITKIGRRFQTN